MNALSDQQENDEASGFPEVSFGRSADGLSVALVADTAFAMVPARDGRYHLATGWRIRGPMAEWTRSDFYGHSGVLADEAIFRAKVLENAEHQREQKALGRREIRSHANTPWGLSQGATVFDEGVVCHSTAGHGGFHLSPERNGEVHPMLGSRTGWYEEDAEWAVVALTFPQLFTSYERKCADRTIRDSWPDAWETIFGRTLAPRESHEKDRRAFEREHAADWVVVSAITSDHHPGFVEVIATIGGKRGAGEERRYLVPSAEYRVDRFGFVVDPSRHRLYDGPSGFIGWQGRVAS